MRHVVSVKSRHANRRLGGRAPAWALNVWLGSEILCRAVLLPFAAAPAASTAGAADWPQPGCNPQHTNFTPEPCEPPYSFSWMADFTPEIIYTAQPVICDGRVFVATQNGNLYALDEKTGRRLWHFRAGDALWGGAAAGIAKWGGAGKVFVASWEGIIYALDAATGAELWRYDTAEPISASPCIAEETVFIGTRKGSMLALSTAGALKWRVPLSWQLYTTAAWDAGRVYAVTEDLYVHCLDSKTGGHIWKSERLYGLMVRDFYPVVTQGRVLVATTPAVWAGSEQAGVFNWTLEPKLMEMLLLNPETLPTSEWKKTRLSRLRHEPPPPEFEEAQERLVEEYRAHPDFQTLYVLGASDGKQAYHAVHYYSDTGLNVGHVPPAVCADGTVLVRFGGLPGWLNVPARLDLQKNRVVDILTELSGPNDNASFVSVTGDRVIWRNVQSGSLSLDLMALPGAPPDPITVVPPHAIQNLHSIKPERISVMSEGYQPLVAYWGWGERNDLICPRPIANKRIYGMAYCDSPQRMLVCWKGK